MNQKRRTFLRFVASLAVVVAAAVATPATAGAGMIVAVSMDRLGVTGQDLDITLFDPFQASGVLALPAGMNTTHDETDVAMSGDARRLAAVTNAGPSLRMLDRTTEEQGSFLVPLEGESPGDIVTPGGGFGFSPDGRMLAVSDTTSGSPPPKTTRSAVFDASSFPRGPLTRSGFVTGTYAPLQQPGTRGQVLGKDPAISNSGQVAWVAFGNTAGLALGPLGGTARVAEVRGSQPALRPGDTSHVWLTSNNNLKTVKFDASPGLDTLSLPNTSLSGDEAFPNWTADGRFLVWLDLGEPVEVGGNTLREGIIKVYDTETQQLVAARSLGRKKRFNALAVGQSTRLISTFSIPDSTFEAGEEIVSLSSALTTRTTVGILVQRIVGSRLLFGRRAPRLAPVGRVPLGSRAKGRNRIAWNGRVNGRRLAPGLYQITLRAFRGSRVNELSPPVRFRVRP